ncbi:DEAD/DEAH box helicase family protein [Neobacillus cucumis]|uniref:DEAD/DEAH box helicase family protein n=1 Tax=Neobacillus cucumis TaxID=1740721 RepID=UPI00203DD244|nr:DEAD/DEAH box helicase family protein [Neobacillus cucumis]MCM3729944.1 DEAD/DEAH box helicase family protein [Neobacillus cucumis]
MSFKNLNLKDCYRSSDDNVLTNFYIPTLSIAKNYKRAVGFFSSTALIELSKGISGLLKNGGKIELIASPKLDEKDLLAINKGYEMRQDIIEQAILKEIKRPKDKFEEERLNYIAHLIEHNQLDIKLAFMESNGSLGMYHEKIGLIYDDFGNKIAFNGSLNETQSAFFVNFESIDVFCSWNIGDSSRVQRKEEDFAALWENKTNKVKVLEFPKVAKDILLGFKKNILVDETILEKRTNYFIDNTTVEKYPKIPEDINMFEYQLEAISTWKENNFRGIFNMATGTGKTYTGLAGIVELSNHLNKRLGIIIVCPYQHLVDQWVEDIVKFNMEPIIAYSTSQQKNWKKKLKDAVIDYNLGIVKSFTLVTTNATFSTEFVQGQIKRIKGNFILLVDEAHNFGATKLSQNLLEHTPYRLALSATLERHGDEQGTQKLYNFFGEVCINYTLERAIREDKLTKYYYKPVVTYLNDYELEEYLIISKEIARCLVEDDSGKQKLNERGKKLAIKRARLIAGAVDKLSKLKQLIEDNEEIRKNIKHSLVYCGATTISDSDFVDGEANYEELKQIDAVLKILGNDLGIKAAKFTAQETSLERNILKKEFAEGKSLETLVAIRCLDEGVNIPEIKTAFILASSTNPKEYVQRRGRILRKSPNKNIAIIYDFITLPRSLESVKSLSKIEIQQDLSLVKKEISRMRDFAEISSNPYEGLKLIDEMKSIYEINEVIENELKFG